MLLPVIPYAPSVTLDFNMSETELLTLTGDVTFTSAAHQRINSKKILKLVASGDDRSLTFPTDWVFVGGTAPATLESGRSAILTLQCYGTADSDIIATYAEQDEANGGESGGGSLPSFTGKANYDVQVNGAANDLLYRKKLYIDLRDYNGLDGTFTNDNTSIFQQAIDEAAAFGSIDIVVPSGHYAIGGALQTTDGTNAVNNAQLYFPYREQGVNPYRVRIIGSSKQKNAIAEYALSAAGDSTGTILESTILGSGYMFGNAYSDPSYGGFHYGDFSFGAVDYENLSIRLRSKTGSTHVSNGMGAINGRNISQMTVRHLLIDVQSLPTDLVTPVSGSTGIIFPQRNNNGDCVADDLVIARGFDDGLNIGEHFNGGYIAIGQCTNAVATDTFSGACHPAIIKKLSVEGSGCILANRSSMNVIIHQISTERGSNPGKYFDYVRDVYSIGTGITTILDFEPTGTAAPNYGFYTNDFSKVSLKRINDVDLDETLQVLSAGTFALNSLYGKFGKVSLTSNSVVTAMPNPDVRKEFTLIATQDATGGRTLGWPTGVFLSGSPVTTANYSTEYRCKYSGSTWFVQVIGYTTASSGSSIHKTFDVDLTGWHPQQTNGSIATIASHNGGNRLHLKAGGDSGFVYINAITPGSTITSIVVEVNDLITTPVNLVIGDFAGGTGSYVILPLSAGTNTFTNISTAGVTVGDVGISAPYTGSGEAWIDSTDITP